MAFGAHIQAVRKQRAQCKAQMCQKPCFFYYATLSVLHYYQQAEYFTEGKQSKITFPGKKTSERACFV